MPGVKYILYPLSLLKNDSTESVTAQYLRKKYFMAGIERVTVHSVHSNVAKIHSRLPAAMEFWLVCLGILTYSCQNTSRDTTC